VGEYAHCSAPDVNPQRVGATKWIPGMVQF
jgi:hypothetical protein